MAIRMYSTGTLLAIGAHLSALALTGALVQGCRETDDGSGFRPDAGTESDGADPKYAQPFSNAGDLRTASCAQATDRAQRVPAYMLFVLDGSGSMTQDNKWTAATGALGSLFDEIRNQAPTSIAVGLTVFADRRDFTATDHSAGPYASIDVPLGFVDTAKHTSLRERVDLTEPFLGTPTYEVLNGQYPQLAAYTPTSPIEKGGKRVLVFMSDGIPDPDMPAGKNEAPWSLNLATEWAGKPEPIITFSVGIGSLNAPQVYDPKFMAQLAVNGKGAKAGCDPNETANESKMCHFQITPGGKSQAQLTTEFLNAINAIRAQAMSCEFTLQQTGGTLDVNKVNVIYTTGGGGQSIVPKNDSEGWAFDNTTAPTKVILNGAICTQVKGDPNGKVEIVVGCASVIR